MSEFKKDDWVKLVDADCNDRKAGLVNGAVGQVSGSATSSSSIIDFGGANHLMWSQQCVLISPAEAASVGDTVIIGADVRDALDNLETEMRKQNELERGR